MNQHPLYPDLGDAWLSQQTARIRQRHLQFGRHVRPDHAALLERAASMARASRAMRRMNPLGA